MAQCVCVYASIKRTLFHLYGYNVCHDADVHPYPYPFEISNKRIFRTTPNRIKTHLSFHITMTRLSSNYVENSIFLSSVHPPLTRCSYMAVHFWLARCCELAACSVRSFGFLFISIFIFSNVIQHFRHHMMVVFTVCLSLSFYEINFMHFFLSSI